MSQYEYSSLNDKDYIKLRDRHSLSVGLFDSSISYIMDDYQQENLRHYLDRCLRMPILGNSLEGSDIQAGDRNSTVISLVEILRARNASQVLIEQSITTLDLFLSKTQIRAQCLRPAALICALIASKQNRFSEISLSYISSILPEYIERGELSQMEAFIAAALGWELNFPVVSELTRHFCTQTRVCLLYTSPSPRDS